MIFVNGRVEFYYLNIKIKLWFKDFVLYFYITLGEKLATMTSKIWIVLGSEEMSRFAVFVLWSSM